MRVPLCKLIARIFELRHNIAIKLLFRVFDVMQLADISAASMSLNVYNYVIKADTCIYNGTNNSLTFLRERSKYVSLLIKGDV
jgi:hypothetical protein